MKRVKTSVHTGSSYFGVDKLRKLKGIFVQMLETSVQTGKCFTLTTVTKDNYVLEYENVGVFYE